MDNQKFNCGDVIIFLEGNVKTIEKITNGVVHFDGYQILCEVLKNNIRHGICMRVLKDEDKGAISEILSFINNVVYISWTDKQ